MFSDLKTPGRHCAALTLLGAVMMTSAYAAPPPEPVVTLAAATKQLRFSWASVPTATTYRLMRNVDGVSAFKQVGADLPATATATMLNIAVHRHDWPNTLYRVDACNSDGCSPSVATSAASVMLQAIGYFKASNTDAADLFGSAVAVSGDGNTVAVAAPFEDSGSPGINGDQLDNTILDAGAVYVFVRVGGTGAPWIQQAYVKPFHPDAGDRFGTSLALSNNGSTLIVGAVNEDSAATDVDGDQADDSAINSGAAYVFTRSGTQWTQQAYLKATNTGAVDQFGSAVAVSSDGNTAAISAIGEDSNATGVGGDQDNDTAFSSGAVYVFVRTGTTWSQQAYLKSSNTDPEDSFGSSLSLSGDGNTLAAAAIGEDSAAIGVNGDEANNDAPLAGATYVFVRSGATWAEQAYLKASNTATGDNFGSALALSGTGDTLAIGARNEAGTDNNAPLSGAMYVFVRSGGTWAQQAYLKASNTPTGDQFGASVALSSNGSMLLVGAPGEDSAATGINGDQVDNRGPNSGAAYWFVRNGSQWLPQLAYVKASNTGVFDAFGSSLSMSVEGNTIVVGAAAEASGATGANGGDQNDENAQFAGAAYLY